MRAYTHGGGANWQVSTTFSLGNFFLVFFLSFTSPPLLSLHLKKIPLICVVIPTRYLSSVLLSLQDTSHLCCYWYTWRRYLSSVLQCYSWTWRSLWRHKMSKLLCVIVLCPSFCIGDHFLLVLSSFTPVLCCQTFSFTENLGATKAFSSLTLVELCQYITGIRIDYRHSVSITHTKKTHLKHLSKL